MAIIQAITILNWVYDKFIGLHDLLQREIPPPRGMGQKSRERVSIATHNEGYGRQVGMAQREQLKSKEVMMKTKCKAVFYKKLCNRDIPLPTYVQYYFH